jgi:hypothetical protein
MRKIIERLILAEAEERGMELTEEELMESANGVEYWFDVTVPDSIDTALSNIQYDRRERAKEVFVTVEFYTSGDESGHKYTIEFISDLDYAEWLEDMGQSVEIFSEKFM